VAPPCDSSPRRRQSACGGVFAAAVEDPWVAQKILACLDLPARAPPLAPAAAEAADLDLVPVEDFDQSPPYEDP
jgi:hypothetical protein